MAEIGDRSGTLWREAFGAQTFPEDGDAVPAAAETIFDLASLTKPLATTAVAMNLVTAGRLRLDELIASRFDEWRGAARETVTVADLLEHSSGLSARLIDRPPGGRREFQHDICTLALEYEPRAQSIYSDLGFILLGFLVEDVDGRTLDAQFAEIQTRVTGTAPLTFGVDDGGRARVAPTRPLDDDVRRGRLLAGEVHDAYASALGGVAGHAGLFGTVGAVGALARVVLSGACGDNSLPEPFTPLTVSRTIRKTRVPGSSRALGWDTMLPTSSCGSEMSFAAFGHVGFTGTSLWIDPILDRYFVLLTNRAYGGGTLEQMRDVRRAFHDAAVELFRT